MWLMIMVLAAKEGLAWLAILVYAWPTLLLFLIAASCALFIGLSWAFQKIGRGCAWVGGTRGVRAMRWVFQRRAVKFLGQSLAFAIQTAYVVMFGGGFCLLVLRAFKLF